MKYGELIGGLAVGGLLGWYYGKKSAAAPTPAGQISSSSFIGRAGYTCASWLAQPRQLQVAQASVWLGTGHAARETGTTIGMVGVQVSATGPDAASAMSVHPLANAFVDQTNAACLAGQSVFSWTWPSWWTWGYGWGNWNPAYFRGYDWRWNGWNGQWWNQNQNQYQPNYWNTSNQGGWTGPGSGPITSPSNPAPGNPAPAHGAWR